MLEAADRREERECARLVWAVSQLLTPDAIGAKLARRGEDLFENLAGRRTVKRWARRRALATRRQLELEAKYGETDDDE